MTCFYFLSSDEWLGKEARSQFLPWKSEGQGEFMHSDHSLYFRFTMASVDHDPQRPKTPNTHLPVHWHSENFGLEVCKGWAIANVKWLPVPQAFLLSPQESIITKPGKPLVSRLPAAHRGGAGRRGGGFSTHASPFNTCPHLSSEAMLAKGLQQLPKCKDSSLEDTTSLATGTVQVGKG